MRAEGVWRLIRHGARHASTVLQQGGQARLVGVALSRSISIVLSTLTCALLAALVQVLVQLARCQQWQEAALAAVVASAQEGASHPDCRDRGATRDSSGLCAQPWPIRVGPVSGQFHGSVCQATLVKRSLGTNAKGSRGEAE
eukprot:CAMPEP_0119171486 /NCGR_PEP_ID=MMETSP1315-20130426/24982_1 /TAXON_ID=676789 /ORGANISM="Prasinoderma singularis, Strain RCC927" /LENGTH=141 /DNA_ID=CAMNT_0007165333 /DNA_START=136 /DNA_END=562 /DNA_ORIENTATION=+